MNRLRQSIHHSALMILCPAVCACGGSGSDETTNAQQPAVDPRFATAEALAQTFSRLESLGRDAGLAFIEMLYAETPLQEKLLRIKRNRVIVHRAEQAMHDRFGVSLKENDENLFLVPILANATLEEVDDRRAIASMHKDGYTSRAKLYLVKVGNRWWISLCTMEYLFGEKETEDLNWQEPVFRAMAAGAEEVMTGLQSNLFTDASEARAAYKAASIEYNLAHPDEFDDM